MLLRLQNRKTIHTDFNLNTYCNFYFNSKGKSAMTSEKVRCEYVINKKQVQLIDQKIV